MKRRLAWFSKVAALAFLGALFAPGTVHADAAYSDPRVATLMQRLVSSAATPEQYTADVKLHARLRVFPWISITLHGNEVYKHPGFYHFVFRGVPKAVQGYSDMAYSIGDAVAWPQKYDISLLETSAGGHPVLRLVPKTQGLVRSLDVTVDPETARLERWVWSRNDGGSIAVSQHYEKVQSSDVVAQQDATIRIPHMAVDLSASYSNFTLQEAVAVADRP